MMNPRLDQILVLFLLFFLQIRMPKNNLSNTADFTVIRIRMYMLNTVVQLKSWKHDILAINMALSV